MQAADLTILQVSPNDVGGGAEKVASDLHLRYLDAGADAWLALGADHGRFPHSLQIPNTAHRSRWARAVLGAAGLADPAATPALPRSLQRAARFLAEPGRYRRVMDGLEDFDAPGTAHLLELPPRMPHVLHLHNLHGAYFDIRELPRLSRRVPTIISLHDVWLLTGHCAHPLDCPGWLDGCGGCPALDRYVPIRRDASDENFRLKLEALRGGRVHVAAPSRWLADLVSRSPMGAEIAELRVIPNGVDPSVFSPGDRAAARVELGLPADALVIGFAARGGVSSPFKGFDTLQAALPQIAGGLRDREVLLVAVGEPAPADDDSPLVRYVDFLREPARMAQFYRAIDLYLHPARAESFGLTVLEAMACGAPVVTTDAGGLPEVVEDGVSGLLVPVGDARALATAALSVATDDARRGALARAGIERAARFSVQRQANAYLDWYLELQEPAANPAEPEPR